MILWFDFFLQAFITAFAWIAAVIAWVLVVIVLGNLFSAVGAALPFRGDR